MLWKIFAVRVPVWLYRRTGGRIMPKRLLLTTRGRKSGLTRTVPMGFTPHDGGFLVVASNRGLDTMPAWYLNLRATPEVTVEVGSRRFRGRAEQLPAAERAAMWPLVTARLPEYGKLQRKTSRSFPIVRLMPFDEQ